jgi:hypothetical protein
MGNKWSQASFSSDALSFDRWNGIISRGNGSSVFTSLRTKCYRELVGFQFECISGIPVSLPLRCHIIPGYSCELTTEMPYNPNFSTLRYTLLSSTTEHYMFILTVEVPFTL